jgi:hypothetical protein
MKWLVWALEDSDASSVLEPDGYAGLPTDMRNSMSRVLYSLTCGEKQILYTDYSVISKDEQGYNAFLSLAIIFMILALILGVAWQYINQSRCTTMVLVYQFMLMSGIILTYLSVIFFYQTPTSDATCHLRIWFPTLGYTLILVATFERTWQIHTVYEKVRRKDKSYVIYITGF